MLYLSERNVWRYQRDNQKSWFEGAETIQWPNENEQNTKKTHNGRPDNTPKT